MISVESLQGRSRNRIYLCSATESKSEEERFDEHVMLLTISPISLDEQNNSIQLKQQIAMDSPPRDKLEQ